MYVLDPKLQDGHKLLKWDKRSRCGMYLGASPTHHDTVGRILNFDTGYITPQYHVIYDELFTTVPGYLTDPLFDSDLWNLLITLDGLDNSIDPSDRSNASVLQPATTWFELFHDSSTSESDSDSDSDDGDDAMALDPPDSVPEGEDVKLILFLLLKLFRP